MKELFKNILKMDGVNGVLLLSFEGLVLFESHSAPLPMPTAKQQWQGLVAALDSTREADLIFRDARIYLRRSEIGYLIVLMSSSVSAAMLRLNCDILLPSLKPTQKPKGLKKFFKKK